MNDTNASQTNTVEFPVLKGDEITFTMLPVSKLTVFEELTDLSPVQDSSTVQDFIPLIVVARGDGYVIVDGCKRYGRAVKRNLTEAACCIVGGSIDGKRAGLLRIMLNRGRVLSFKEKILFIRYLKAHLEKIEFEKHVELLGIPSKDKHDFERISQCSPEIIDAVERGSLDISTAGEVSRIGDNDSEAIIKLFSCFQFTRQMQRELIEWIPEIAFREKKSVAEVISSEWMAVIINNEKMNGPQKMQKVRDAVFEYRFPNLANAKKVWKDLVKSVNPDASRVAFGASDSFEKNRLEVKVTLTDPSQAAKIFGKLSQLDPEKWDRLIYPGM